MCLANGDNYRENRWFSPWPQENRDLLEFVLPEETQNIIGQKTTMFGNGVIQCVDTVVACESCEELWVPNNPNIEYGLDGVEIIGNGSGSHHELRKLDSRLNLIQSASQRNGGVYLYSNVKGCDGGRMYFDGSSIISINGQIAEQLP